MNKIGDIKELLIEKLEAMKNGDGDDLFGEVFGYAQGDFSKYPVAVVKPVGGRGQVIDTHRNERTFQFIISLYQEQSQAGRTKQEADEIMTECSDVILEEFDKDKTLGDEVEIVRVVEFDTDFRVAAGTFNFANFRVDCMVVVPNYDES